MSHSEYYKRLGAKITANVKNKNYEILALHYNDNGKEVKGCLIPNDEWDLESFDIVVEFSGLNIKLENICVEFPVTQPKVKVGQIYDFIIRKGISKNTNKDGMIYNPYSDKWSFL